MTTIEGLIGQSIDMMFHFNPWLSSGFLVFFVYGILYSCGFPRSVNLPAAAMLSMVFVARNVPGGEALLTPIGTIMLLIIGAGTGMLINYLLK